MPDAFRLGIVGCGGIAERHARAAAASPEVALVACCDVRPGLADAWAERHACERAFADYRAMIREHELDGVLLATWPNLHREQVLGCLEAGVRAVLHPRLGPGHLGALPVHQRRRLVGRPSPPSPSRP